jgi:hypothetical protein
MSGSMSGVWKRRQGRPSEAPPDERGGKQIWSTYSYRATPRLYTTRKKLTAGVRSALVRSPGSTREALYFTVMPIPSICRRPRIDPGADSRPANIAPMPLAHPARIVEQPNALQMRGWTVEAGGAAAMTMTTPRRGRLEDSTSTVAAKWPPTQGRAFISLERPGGSYRRSAGALKSPPSSRPSRSWLRSACLVPSRLRRFSAPWRRP